jgi:hypothetical protein
VPFSAAQKPVEFDGFLFIIIMPRITNLFKEKVYIFSRQQEVYENEKVLIEKLFTEKELGNIVNIDFIDANINNDAFLVKTQSGEFCVKLSLDAGSSNLKKEFDILEKNIHKRISAYPIAYGVDNSIEYSIVGFLPMPNVASAGVASIINKDYAVPFFLKQLSEFEVPNDLPSYSDYLDEYLNFDIFRVPDAEIDWLKNHSKLRKLISEEILYIQNILKNKKHLIDSGANQLCHGNLNQSTMLILSDYVHAINWENAYKGDLLLDILSLRYEFFFSENLEDQMIQKYLDFSKKKIEDGYLKKMKNFAGYFNLLKIMAEYLKEVYVLKAYKKNKVLNCAIKFSKNYDAFYQLPSFDKKLKPIAEFFVESVI